MLLGLDYGNCAQLVGEGWADPLATLEVAMQSNKDLRIRKKLKSKMGQWPHCEEANCAVRGAGEGGAVGRAV